MLPTLGLWDTILSLLCLNGLLYFCLSSFSSSLFLLWICIASQHDCKRLSSPKDYQCKLPRSAALQMCLRFAKPFIIAFYFSWNFRLFLGSRLLVSLCTRGLLFEMLNCKAEQCKGWDYRKKKQAIPCWKIFCTHRIAKKLYMSIDSTQSAFFSSDLITEAEH